MKKLLFLSAIAALYSSLAFSQTRTVLIEHFTNSSCPPCASHSPTLYNFANNNPNITTVIAYHTVFPYNNDSMHHDNPADPTQRAAYYAVSSTPTAVMDGNQFKGATATFNTTISTTINNRALVAPKYTIQNTSLLLANNQLTGSFNFTSINAGNSSENLVAHVVVIEKDVLKSSYAASPGNNSQTHYEYVMRKMIPSATGTTLINKTLNGTDIVPLNWTLSKIKNINQVRVVAFVQNVTTKEVYQAMLFTPQISATGISTSKSELANINVYPNPFADEITVSFSAETFIKEINITDQLGKKVFSQKIDASVNELALNPDLASGIYYLTIKENETSVTKKINVIK